jgi:hypothetical protein
MPFQDISKPVGSARHGESRNDVNQNNDVKLVIQLLNAIPRYQGGPLKPLSYQGMQAIVDSIEMFQLHHFGGYTGRIDPGNVTIVKLNQLANPGASDISGPQSFPAPFGAALLSHATVQLRNAMVTEAEKWVGAMDENRDGKHSTPGLKRNWETILRIHQETIFETLNRREIEQIKKAGIKWESWCGIFAFWCLNNALKSIGIKPSAKWILNSHTKKVLIDGFVLKPHPYKVGQPLGKGDICIVDERSQLTGTDLNHHVILAEEPSANKLKTIEGNYGPDPVTGQSQAIVQRPPKPGTQGKGARSLSEIESVYRLNDIMRPVSL